MSAAVVIVLLWLAFAATHMGLSSQRLRPQLVAMVGERPFLGLYSLAAFATFVPLVWVYFSSKHSGPLLWYLGGSTGLRWTMYVGMGAAFALMVAGIVRPSPASIAPGEAVVRGVFRITRHPLFMGVGLFGLLHLIVVPVNVAELAFFAGFPLFAVIGCHHQDRRKLAAGDDAYRAFCTDTTLLPFARPARVPQAISEDPLPLLAGVGVTVVLRWFHPVLFGWTL